MSSLWLPNPLKGPAEANSSDHMSCGKLATESAAGCLLCKPVSLNIPDNATSTQIANVVNAYPGLSAVEYAPSVSINTLLGQAFAAGAFLIAGINCTSQCVPVTYVTGIRHWLDAYGWDGVTNALAYNCWESTYGPLNLAACHNSQMGTVLVTSTTGGVMNSDQAAALAGNNVLAWQKQGVNIGTATGQPNATPELAAAYLDGNWPAVEGVLNAVQVWGTPSSGTTPPGTAVSGTFTGKTQ